ncbi:MAG: ATP-binding protein [Carboxylicivirga sp.]|jgi:signal transduction histidine kinase/DNA-binding response OmpR family regulator/ligand-binding sensor domain-containing protein|nr:ATP-binding protein [Carboxylicivirga sp.]
MIGKYIVLIALFLIVQLSEAAKIELSMHHWQQNNGLPPFPISSIDQDDNGLIILRCEEGSYRFNGFRSSLFKELEKAEKIDGIRVSNGLLIIDSDTITDGVNGCVKSAGNYYVTASRGLGKLNVTSKTIDWLNSPGELPVNSCTNPVLDKHGRVWFSMSMFGIGFYEPQKQRFYTIQNIDKYTGCSGARETFASILDRDIVDLFFDKDVNLWIATRNDGLYKIAFESKRFQYFRSEYKTHGDLSHRDISSPKAMQNGDIWIATWGGGINVWDRNDLEASQPDFQRLPLRQINGAPLRRSTIFPIVEDEELNVWVGTHGGGLYYLSAERKLKNDYRCIPFTVNNGKLPNDFIGNLCIGINDDVWCGTYGGLVHIDSDFKTRNTFSELDNPNLFEGKTIHMVCITNEKYMWISCRGGDNFLWDLSTNVIKKFRQTDGQDIGMLYNGVELNGVDWFAGDKGVFYYNHRLQKFIAFKNNHLLPSRHIESILSDDNGFLWLGTNQGVVKIDPVEADVKPFNLETGRLGNSCTQGASKDNSGYMYFGTRYGFYRFHPGELDAEEAEKPLLINEVRINGNGFEFDSLKKTEWWKAESDFTGLQLPYNQNNLLVHFNTLNYNPEENILYEIKLEGYEDNWVVTNDNRKSWNYLKPGRYDFKIREKGKPSINGFSVIIQVPWWKHIYAKITYFVILGVLLYVFYIVISRRSRQQEKQRQKEKFDLLRFRFFLNVSHEIRTPLTLIKGSIDRLMENEDATQIKDLERIQHNTHRLTRMVDEVLDLKRMEDPDVKPRKSFFNMKEFLVATVDAFQIREEQHLIQLHLPEKPVWLNGSREQIETILYNLLSNAIKFSPGENTVEVYLEADESECRVLVKDYGIGMTDQEQARVFERYYQAKQKHVNGSGIGLSLVKELCELIGGKISVASNPGEGSVFTLTLPVGVDHKSVESNTELSPKDKKVILIVDDHEDIRSFIKESFEDSYQCIEASNGKEAKELVNVLMPDLIISDVMMPEMNGFEFCKIIKEQIETSHIPIVLLTAKTGYEAEVGAAKCSADAYITKPFQESILRIKVDKLIELRQRLKEKYSGAELDEGQKELNPIDQAFINKLNEALEAALDNSDFNVDQLSSEVALSPSGLYRKVKALTGQSPVDYIRTFRLNKAAYLLKNSTHSIAAIADLTGFGTQKYFSRCFNTKFGVSPSKYRKS